ncbi:hypothetical protein [Arsenicicoccus sp. oral taxon 190]|uniref:hypothetical protein n=1 Tax=Arsenicicoccus sp. oral taxon 190 TaxID=1658671 RepID=UPI0012E1F4AC|nr:hypothetical protein [Arsenicicoccus sp. oral taxon 190]
MSPTTRCVLWIVGLLLLVAVVVPMSERPGSLIFVGLVGLAILGRVVGLVRIRRELRRRDA